MRKRTATALVLTATAVLGSLWALDVNEAQATTQHLSQRVTEVDAARHEALRERMSMEELRDEAEALAESRAQEADILRTRLDKATTQRDRWKARAEERETIAQDQADLISEQEQRIADLEKQVMESQPETWHGLVVGEVIVCEADWIASVDDTREGGQWAACM